MGQFSFYTTDTKKPISCRKPQRIYMAFKDAEGNPKAVIENHYNGYGNFGGLDIFEVLGAMNGVTEKTPLTDETFDKYGIEELMKLFINKKERVRDIAIFAEKGLTEWPQLFAGEIPKEIDFTKPLKQDPNQGWQ
jgi:hypothetical protein